jgi:hypothetical protein
VEKDWFSPWMLAPFLTVPVIIVDAFTLYCCVLCDPEAADGSPSTDDRAGLANPSDIEEIR